MLVELLAAAMGQSPAHWREVVGMIIVTPIWSSPVSNWTVAPRGSAMDVEAAAKAAELIRERYPYAR